MKTRHVSGIVILGKVLLLLLFYIACGIQKFCTCIKVAYVSFMHLPKMRRTILIQKGVIIAVMLAAVVTLLAYARLAVREDRLVCNYAVSMETVTVEKYETLTNIASKYKADYPGTLSQYVVLICKHNGIRNSNTIYTGDVLEIPIYTNIAKK